MTQQEIDAKVAEIEAICLSKKYAFFKVGDYNLNLVAVREDDFYDNRFTDKLYIAYKVKGVWCLLVLPWTTMPGTRGKDTISQPITVLGITGTAVLKEGQYRGTYQFIDNSSNVYGAPYFPQVKDVTVFRDGDKDFVFDRDIPQQTGLFGIMLHAMGFGEFVDTWSIGCQGTQWIYYMELVKLARAQIQAGWGDRFTYTLLHKDDFAKKTSPKRETTKT